MIPLITAQTVAFWVFAPLAVAGGLGMVLSRKPVHSALSLAGMMVALGCLYASLDAPFLFVAQIIVYTGAVMMLFIFTMMIVGVDSVDSLVETIRGQRVASTIAVGALAVLLI
ncbi:MAG: NADH-quinone oxidoreductase subunit J, partial [Brooklawnia sp.]|nr:NADH-quinone oxidoreductase subunit J [Brooklawnia sp.]